MGKELHSQHNKLIQAGLSHKRNGPDVSWDSYTMPAERSRAVLRNAIEKSAAEIEKRGLNRATVSRDTLDLKF